MTRLNHLVILGGGSGAGKSTVAAALAARWPERLSVIHLDDYFRPKADVPTALGMTNWDHPESIRWPDLEHDLETLLAGQPVQIQTKHRAGGGDDLTVKVWATIKPAPILLLEGFLSLWPSGLRKRAAHTIFLDAPADLRLARRTHKRFEPTTEYMERVYQPMHQRYVEPTKQSVDQLIPVTNQSVSVVVDQISAALDQLTVSALE